MIYNFTINGGQYEVCFTFRSERVFSIRIESKKEIFADQYEGIRTLMLKKYGDPVEDRPNLIGRNMKWLTPDGVEVGLYHNDRPGLVDEKISMQYILEVDMNEVKKL